MHVTMDSAHFTVMMTVCTFKDKRVILSGDESINCLSKFALHHAIAISPPTWLLFSTKLLLTFFIKREQRATYLPSTYIRGWKIAV